MDGGSVDLVKVDTVKNESVNVLNGIVAKEQTNGEKVNDVMVPVDTIVVTNLPITSKLFYLGKYWWKIVKRR